MKKEGDLRAMRAKKIPGSWSGDRDLGAAAFSLQLGSVVISNRKHNRRYTAPKRTIESIRGLTELPGCLGLKNSSGGGG